MEGHHQVMKVVGGSRSSNSSSSSSTVQYDHDHDDHDLQSSEEDQMMMMTELRRGPWTVEEDLTLMNYIANHGEGRWNSLARCAGLKRTGKSCRLRWLNYLRPNVRRGNITLEEQLLILELHCRWGNRWSKIAQHLPGRTDNEIKNYWRTRVQKQAKQLKCDVNSKEFKDTMRYQWMPRLVERIQAGASTTGPTNTPHPSLAATTTGHNHHYAAASTTPASSDSFRPHLLSDYNCNSPTALNPDYSCNYNADHCTYLFQGCNDQTTIVDTNNGVCHYSNASVDFQPTLDNNNQWWDQSEMSLWNSVDDFWFLQQHLNNTV